MGFEQVITRTAKSSRLLNLPGGVPPLVGGVLSFKLGNKNPPLSRSPGNYGSTNNCS